MAMARRAYLALALIEGASRSCPVRPLSPTILGNKAALSGTLWTNALARPRSSFRTTPRTPTPSAMPRGDTAWNCTTSRPMVRRSQRTTDAEAQKRANSNCFKEIDL